MNPKFQLYNTDYFEQDYKELAGYWQRKAE